MENIRPPFKIDIAGTFLLPQALKEAREQYRNEQISLVTLRAMEDAEIRNLVERLKSAGLQVVTDGRFRNACGRLTLCGVLKCTTRKR
jgi:methionine synthase II (cobalamin-independent)